MEIAYLAGFFDGEGNIAYHNQPSYKVKRQVAIVVSQRTKPVLEEIGSFLISEGISHFGIYAQRNQWGGAFLLRIDVARDVHRFLNLLLPHLIVKRQEAMDALKYLENSVLPFQRNYKDKGFH